nr:imelysin family protein [Psychrobacter sp. PraFG1]UNK05196.1 hypothetical protein MN210_14760 [Psychrobacter sp. PraFG1]
MATLIGALTLSGCSKEADNASGAENSAEVTNETTETKNTQTLAGDEASVNKLLTSYADMAQAAYEDSLSEAKKLQAAVDALVANPTQQNLEAAQAAYKAARQPYSQTEVFVLMKVLWAKTTSALSAASMAGKVR